MSAAPLDRVPLERMAETRLQAHHALQLLTSFAQACVEPMEDDRHRNFDWDIGVRGFRSRPASADAELTVVFALAEFEVRLERSDAVVAGLPAGGRTSEGLRAELGARLSDALGRDVDLEPPEFELPDHPTEGGTPFGPEDDALRDLADWFTHADLALLRVHDAFEGVCEDIRVWPHHFDLATLLHVDAGTLGLGLSPGDDGVPHPYWYVRGYPEEELRDGDLPELPFGSWTSEGWTGAILEAPEIAAAGNRDARAERVDDFLDAAISACIQLLG